MLMDAGFVEVIKEGEIVQMPRSQAVEEDLFILRDVVEPEREIHGELPRRTPMPPSLEQNASWLDKWKRGDVGNKGNNVVATLITNFHWEIAKKRRVKGWNRRQLAVACEVPEEVIKSVELGELPSDDYVLINRIENVLGTTLRKEGTQSSVSLAELTKMKAERDAQAAIESAAQGPAARSGKPQPAKEDADMSSLLGDDIEIVG